MLSLRLRRGSLGSERTFFREDRAHQPRRFMGETACTALYNNVDRLNTASSALQNYIHDEFCLAKDVPVKSARGRHRKAPLRGGSLPYSRSTAFVHARNRKGTTYFIILWRLTPINHGVLAGVIAQSSPIKSSMSISLRNACCSPSTFTTKTSGFSHRLFA